MLVSRLLLLATILSANIGHTAEFIFYTSINNSLSDESFKRLSLALEQLGHEAKLSIVGSRRTLQLANTIGDGELIRVATITKLFPELTYDLVRVEEPTITVEFVEVSKTITPAMLVGKGKTAILKDVFVLEQRFPTAAQIDDIEKLFELLAADRVEKIVFPAKSLTAIRQHPLFLETYSVSTIDTQQLYTYLHKKHAAIAQQLSAVLKTMNEHE